jgi:protoporphyrinogen/coproporphyrinogen III oxidase
MAGERTRTVIVGAGITGLALSRELAARGHEHLVLESASEPGGAIRTRVVDGRVLEEGPQRTRATRAVYGLIEQLGIGGECIVAPPGLPLYVYARGGLRRVPFTFGAFLTTDLFGPLAKARLLLEPFTGPAHERESVADYFVRRFGRRAYTDLLGPLFGGLYASDPARMSVRHALAPVLRDLGAERSAVLALLRRGAAPARTAPISFRGGLRTLTDALHDSVRTHVRLDTPACRVERAGDGYAVATAAGTVHAQQVVLTVPAPTAATLLAGIAGAAADRLRALRYNPIAIVHLDAPPGPAGLGYQVAFGSTLRTRGVTFNHSLFGRAHLYTAFLGGAHDPALVAADDETIGAIAARELGTVLGVAASPINVARAHVPAWDDSWQALDGIRLPVGIHLAANYESRIGIPGRLTRAAALAKVLG